MIGLDFGTLSGRAVLVRIPDGKEMASAVMDYPHGVMTQGLPEGWALQHPADYLRVLENIIPKALSDSGIAARDVIGIGMDFTASTYLPVDENGTPLCLLPAFEKNPHAYVKLWKHHGPKSQADRMTDLALERGEHWLQYFGGRISSEFTYPKLLETLEEAPEVCRAADVFQESCDWLVRQMTGAKFINSSCAGFKLLCRDGVYPPDDYYAALHPDLPALIRRCTRFPVIASGRKAGTLSPEMAAKLHLEAGICVSAPIIDSYATLPAAGIDRPGKMLLTLGTSAGHMLLSEREVPVPGICGVVKDGFLPGFYGYEAGQVAVGDLLGWCADNCMPAAYANEAAEKGIGPHQLLTEKASALAPGESGLMALDWFNGNRSVLTDATLSGMLLGLTLRTRPEEIYRALIEALAYGTRVIIENFEKGGVPVGQIITTGGIAHKNPLFMQIFADVLRRPLYRTLSKQCAAQGSAILAAHGCGAFTDLHDAVASMSSLDSTVYEPDPARADTYDRLYREYLTLHDYFGRGGNDVMKRLREIG